VPGQHEQGTEVKAITYSAMQIHERETDAEVFVIVDI
jgi:SHS2 domain-containing protein